MGIVSALRRLGHKVTIVSFPGADPERKVTGQAQAAIGERKDGPLASLAGELPEFLFELLEIAYNLMATVRLYRATDKTTGFIYERYSLFMFAGLLVARMRGIPLILEVNDSALVPRVRRLVFRRLAGWFEKQIFRRADGLVFISGYFRDLAQESYQLTGGSPAVAGARVGGPLLVLPNAADLKDFDYYGIDPARLRGELGLEGKVVCGYVGAFVHWHGIDWFVEDILPMLRDFPDLVLLLVGDGVCYPGIQKQVIAHNAESQVLLTGRLRHSEVAEYLAAMDFGVLPDSNEYGSPMKLFEFMAMGKAMVAPAFSPICEVVRDAETAWLFPAGDRAACVARVLEVYQDRSAQRRVGEQARSYIETERQWIHNAEQILGLVNT
ncbi:glycosyltransferase family 4 protein [Haliea sp. E1-2-M8]|uniref:glycosyltransferase family 4 protein n=1 Tax=Haliea sp. E1-2-M8 TaxID=3064706 RepID=UPI00351BF834